MKFDMGLFYEKFLSHLKHNVCVCEHLHAFLCAFPVCISYPSSHVCYKNWGFNFFWDSMLSH
jgi:hypothetical protein